MKVKVDMMGEKQSDAVEVEDFCVMTDPEEVDDLCARGQGEGQDKEVKVTLNGGVVFVDEEDVDEVENTTESEQVSYAFHGIEKSTYDDIVWLQKQYFVLIYICHHYLLLTKIS